MAKRLPGKECHSTVTVSPSPRLFRTSDRVSIVSLSRIIANCVGFIAMSSRASQRNDGLVASPSESSRPASNSHNRHLNISPRKDSVQTPTGSPSQSRAASPLRLFGWNLHRAHSRDEPFIPVDPFQLHFRFFASPSSTPSRHNIELLDIDCSDTCNTCLPLPINCTPGSRFRFRSCGHGLRIFLMDTLPRQIYLHALFRLPALYFSRVSRIFEDAEVSKHEVQRMIEACAPARDTDDVAAGIGANLGFSASFGAARSKNGGTVFPFPEDWNPPTVSPALSRFKQSWESFVDTLIREWKTLNLVSVLLCTCAVLALTHITMLILPPGQFSPCSRFKTQPEILSLALQRFFR